MERIFLSPGDEGILPRIPFVAHGIPGLASATKLCRSFNNKRTRGLPPLVWSACGAERGR